MSSDIYGGFAQVGGGSCGPQLFHGQSIQPVPQKVHFFQAGIFLFQNNWPKIPSKKRSSPEKWEKNEWFEPLVYVACLSLFRDRITSLLQIMSSQCYGHAIGTLLFNTDNIGHFKFNDNRWCEKKRVFNNYNFHCPFYHCSLCYIGHCWYMIIIVGNGLSWC